jgi:hypothetical protein
MFKLFILGYLLVGVIIALCISYKYKDLKFQKGSIFRIIMAMALWPFVVIMELNDSSGD